MIFQEFEFHIMSKMCFSDLLDKIQRAGYKYKLELIKGEEGAKMHIMTNNMHVESMIDLYEEDDGYYTYEIKTRSKDDFAKMHDIMSAI